MPELITGTTESGFEFAIDRDASDDWETLKLIRKANDDASYLIDVAERLLGAEQLRKLEEYCRKDGKVRLSLLDKELSEILEKAGETKNSYPSPA